MPFFLIQRYPKKLANTRLIFGLVTLKETTKSDCFIEKFTTTRKNIYFLFGSLKTATCTLH
jgi:hypothetical protein